MHQYNLYEHQKFRLETDCKKKYFVDEAKKNKSSIRKILQVI